MTSANSQVRYTIRIIKDALPFWRNYAIGFLALFISVGASLAVPTLIKYGIDTITKDASYNLYVLGGFIILASFLTGLMNFISRYYNEVAAQATIRELRNKMFEHLQYQTLSFYQEEETGQLMARVTTDLNAMRRYLSMGFRILLQGTLTFIGVIIFMFMTSMKLALMVSVLFPFLTVLAVRFSKLVAPIFLAQRQKFGELTSESQETLTGIHVVKGFGIEEKQYQKFREANDGYLELRVKGAKIRAKYIPLITFAISIETLLVIIFGGIQVMQGVITIGTLVAFISYLGMLAMPARFLAWNLVLEQRARASAIRYYEILDKKIEVTEPRNPVIPPATLQGVIDFKHVSFKYGEGVRVLDDVTLHIPAKANVAVLGRTGSGKSSLIGLIPRFYDPTSGEVLVDGVNVKEYALEPYRKKIGIVTQDIFLFNTSIKDIISFGRPDASMEEIIHVAKQAHAHEFIEKTPGGYDAIVGENGISLSGGQKQRLALARALLLNPQILILDDSTSSVDTETESLIQKDLLPIMKKRTTIIITNRVSGLREVDTIIILDNGRIVEQGSHKELMEKRGLYFKIYTSQVNKALVKEQLVQQKKGA